MTLLNDLWRGQLMYTVQWEDMSNKWPALPKHSARPFISAIQVRRAHGSGCAQHYSTLMAICPCRVGGAVWNHTAWLFPLMPLPTLSLFYSYFLSGNKYRKNITCKNIGQFQFCINLLPLELIWRSASCPRHWNQRWFGDAAFTIPSGKQWDHMSPWPPSWLSAGIDECCRSANESGHQWLKNSWLETIWH